MLRQTWQKFAFETVSLLHFGHDTPPNPHPQLSKKSEFKPRWVKMFLVDLYGFDAVLFWASF